MLVTPLCFVAASISLTSAQQIQPNAVSAAPRFLQIKQITGQLPNLDARAVALANQQLLDRGASDVCVQAINRMAAQWRRTSSVVDKLFSRTRSTPLEAIAAAAVKAMNTISPILSRSSTLRVGQRFDQADVATFEDSGSAIGQAMGAIAQIDQVTAQQTGFRDGSPPQLLASQQPFAADRDVRTLTSAAQLTLNDLRNAQFASWGACGSVLGATMRSPDELAPPGLPGSLVKVQCRL
ncbi:hypothetical protein PYCC9005_000550 [Savitreella phatthalungensis]